MAETQEKSGTAGTSMNPVEQDVADGDAATGSAAVGRATVPADSSSSKFTRAPGMPPPPDELPDNPESGATQQHLNGATAEATQVAADGGSPDSAAASRQPSSGPPYPGSPGPAQPPPGTAQPNSGVGPLGRVAGRVGLSTGGGSGRTGLLGRAGLPAAGATAAGAARVSEAVRVARSTVSAAATRGPRRARLNIKRIDPWSVMKFSFAVSLVLFVVIIVATAVLYLALDAMGVFQSANSVLADLVGAAGGAEAGNAFRVTAKGVIGTSALIGIVNVVLFTALATLGAFIYNVCADLVGGIEVTLSERE